MAIDADVVARDVLDRGQPALDAVVARFGAALLGPDGSLDRAALGRIVFTDPAAMRDLEVIVHPAVRPRILSGIAVAEAEGAVVVVIEAIKLVEGGLSGLCDEVWLVMCDRERQRARLVGRGSSPDEAAERIAAQAGLVERVVSTVTRTIDTSSDERSTRAMVDTTLDAALSEVAGAATE